MMTAAVLLSYARCTQSCTHTANKRHKHRRTNNRTHINAKTQKQYNHKRTISAVITPPAAPAMKRILLARHGECDMNLHLHTTIGGQSNASPLTSLGVQQAEDLGRHLAAIQVLRVG